MSEYLETVDYKAEHLAFLRTRPNFKPYHITELFKTYIDQMHSMYYGNHASIKENYTAYLYFRDDYNTVMGKTKEKTKLRAEELFGGGTEVKGNEYFLTFNFDPKKWNAKDAVKYLAKFMEKSWVKKLKGVFEYHGEEKNHPHLMVYLTTELLFGKLKDKLTQVSLYTKLMSGINFMDIKKWIPDRHEPYINLQKRDSKQESLAKDELWRIENNLPHKVEK